MKGKRYSVEQIVAAVKQHDAGMSVGEICRKLGIAEATFYRWKKRYGELEPDEVRELKQLRDENAKLKRLVADLSLDKAMLQDLRRESGERVAAQGRGTPPPILVRGKSAPLLRPRAAWQGDVQVRTQAPGPSCAPSPNP